ncbi:sensor histidine kinase [Promicromonospora sp. CA-289599]|uniref:sensor histidine kinase n=1 Tax=Promicromonospora sp. CA-289599 TaxID=3240014 RepID=UPI003D94B156
MSAIRSVWDEPRPADPPVRVWRDWVLVAVVVAGAVIEAVTRTDVQGRWLELATVVVLAPTLLCRRTHPLTTVAVAFVASTAPALVLGRDLAFASNIFMLVLAYALFRWGSGRAIVLGVAVVLAKMGTNVALGFLTLADVGIGCLILGSTFALGLALRYRSGARRREREQVVLLERERLARDLHDVVGHHISAVAVRAQAGLAVSQTDPGAAAESLRVIEEQASRALAEMRTLVRVLRSDELRPGEDGGDGADELAPGPTLADVERLADPTVPHVGVDLEGDPARVSAAVGGAVHRIAQESVTNARRHARGATRIAVRVTVGETSVRLRVSDDGGAPVSPTRAGYGLAGMRERAALLGGTLDAGPDAAGWTVEANLPLTGAV